MTVQSVIVAGSASPTAATPETSYEYEDTRALVALVNDAAGLVAAQGEAAFGELRAADSRWRQGETYVFVLDPDGSMLVHPDPELEGRNVLDLRDIAGKPIIRGLIRTATTARDKPEGWYHYQWPVPGEILPRWKSSFVRLVRTPSGTSCIVGSGMYNDRMERAFVVDAVANAVAEIEQRGRAAFPLLRDPTGPFIAKDAYVFVTDMAGVELVNPAFPDLEGRDLLDLKDTRGKYLNREMIALVRTRGAGWVDYMFPRPGESFSTQKSAFVRRAMLGDRPVMVGCGVYLADAPKESKPLAKLTPAQLMTLVRDAAAVLAEQGEKAYADLRTRGSRWFRDDTYLFVFAMDGTRVFHAVEPESEGRNDHDLLDAIRRPIFGMIRDAATSPAGEGWAHYMYPEPGSIFPTWKSSFVKRVRFPSGTQHIVGCGIYAMQMDRAFIEDVVNRAAALIEAHGRDAFDRLRDRTGPFVFMDTYVFVLSPDGTQLVNAAFPALEGRILLDLKDVTGRPVIREEIAAAMSAGSAWLEFNWYRPGQNTPAPKLTYARKVEAGGETFVIGSGIYMD